MKTAIFIACIPGLLGCCCIPTTQSQPSPTGATTESAVPSDPVKRPITFSEIKRNRSEVIDPNLTEAQRKGEWDKHIASLKRFSAENWTGIVLDAKKRAFGDEHYLEIDMLENQDGKPDVYLYMSQSQALQPRRGDKIVFSGPITGLWPEINQAYAVEIDCIKLEVTKE